MLEIVQTLVALFARAHLSAKAFELEAESRWALELYSMGSLSVATLAWCALLCGLNPHVWSTMIVPAL